MMLRRMGLVSRPPLLNLYRAGVQGATDTKRRLTEFGRGIWNDKNIIRKDLQSPPGGWPTSAGSLSCSVVASEDETSEDEMAVSAEDHIVPSSPSSSPQSTSPQLLPVDMEIDDIIPPTGITDSSLPLIQAPSDGEDVVMGNYWQARKNQGRFDTSARRN